MRTVFAALMALLPGAALAQTLPVPDADNPRLQTVHWAQGADVLLTAMPLTGLTVMLEPGEQVSEVVLGQPDAAQVTVSAERDSVLIVPRTDLAGVPLRVQTDRRVYSFTVRTEASLLAAYLVRLAYPDDKPSGPIWAYQLKGDRSVRPAAISDDGVRTRIAFGPDQALPAVFALGPTGDEEVVNGYMRGDHFVIDRVYAELVFRIDKAKATARRAGAEEQRP